MLEALAFARFVLEVHEIGTINKSRCHGNAKTQARRDHKQADALKVTEMQRLRRVLELDDSCLCWVFTYGSIWACQMERRTEKILWDEDDRPPTAGLVGAKPAISDSSQHLLQQEDGGGCGISPIGDRRLMASTMVAKQKDLVRARLELYRVRDTSTLKRVAADPTCIQLWNTAIKQKPQPRSSIVTFQTSGGDSHVGIRRWHHHSSILEIFDTQRLPSLSPECPPIGLSYANGWSHDWEQNSFHLPGPTKVNTQVHEGSSPATTSSESSSSADSSSDRKGPVSFMRTLVPEPAEGMVYWEHKRSKVLHLTYAHYSKIFVRGRVIGPLRVKVRGTPGPACSRCTTCAKVVAERG